MRARSGGNEVRSDDRDCDGRESIFWPLWRVTWYRRIYECSRSDPTTQRSNDSSTEHEIDAPSERARLNGRS